MAQPMSTIREWLEETADELMRNANTTVVQPHGVCELRMEMDADVEPVDVGQIYYARARRAPRTTFIAELENGNTIETTRG